MAEMEARAQCPTVATVRQLAALDGAVAGLGTRPAVLADAPKRLRDASARLLLLAQRVEHAASGVIVRAARRSLAARAESAAAPAAAEAPEAAAAEAPAKRAARRETLGGARRAPLRPKLTKAAARRKELGAKKAEEAEAKAAAKRKELLGGGWCGATAAWVEQDRRIARKISKKRREAGDDDVVEAEDAAEASDGAEAPPAARKRPCAREAAERAALRWLRKAEAGDVGLDVAEVEGVVAALRRARGRVSLTADRPPMTLAAARASLREAIAKLLGGDASVEVEVERWDQVVRQHPDYKRELDRERRRWDALQADATRDALAAVRGAVPPDIRTGGWSRETLGALLPAALAKRVLATRALWLARLRPETVARAHVADLRSAYAVSGLDVVELRAVYASLPTAFENDGDGRKRAWAEGVREKLVSLVAREASLDARERRHPAWDGDFVLPFDGDSLEPEVAVEASGLEGAADARGLELARIRADRAAAPRADLGARVAVRKPRPAATKLAADDPRSAMLAAIHGLGCDAKPRAARAGLFAAIKKRGSDDDENVSPQTGLAPAARAGLFGAIKQRGSDDDENVSPQTGLAPAASDAKASRAGLFAELRAAAA